MFEEHFVIGAALRLADDLEPGIYPVGGSLRYQACDDRMCYLPTRVPVSFDVTVAPASRELTRSASAALLDALDFASVAADAPGDAAGAPGADRGIDLAAADPDGGAAPATGGASGVARLGQFELLGTAGYADVDEFLGFIERAESGEAEQGWFEGRGPIAIVALILIGGLALNLTPCVLPMIPINLAIIGAGARAGSRRRGFVLGSAYGLAMAMVYGVLGLVVILTAGTFGTINASPWFNLGIALLFVVLALAMFDRLAIDFSRFQSRFTGGPQGAGSLPVAFGMGGVAALLAGACVAPVVIQVIVFSSNLYATGTAVALALPFLLGLGMAVPWPIAGAGLSFLPKPGPWMVRVRQAFGVFILGTAVYYGYLSYGLFSPALGRPRAGGRERAGAHRRRVVRHPGSGTRRRGVGRQAGARRRLGHLVQELPDHGPHHAQGPVGRGRSRRLRQDQVPGRGPVGLAGVRGHGAVRGHRPARLRHSATGRALTGALGACAGTALPWRRFCGADSSAAGAPGAAGAP